MSRMRVRRVLYVTAAAAGLFSLLGCAPKQEPKEIKSVTFEQNVPIPTQLSLLKTEEGGRTGPIGDNYRPQIRFAHDGVEATCAVMLGNSAVALEPGHSTDATLACDAIVHADSRSNTFTMLEGGKPVGSGTIAIP
jgi:translation elongation factor EF-Tu-like GTPase